MKRTFRLVGLDCANCAAKIERDIKKLPEVQAASLNLLTTRLIIEADEENIASVSAKAEKIVNKYEPDVVFKRG